MIKSKDTIRKYVLIMPNSNLTLSEFVFDSSLVKESLGERGSLINHPFNFLAGLPILNEARWCHY